MLKVGITGGIGSGKSTVCQVFETLGIPVLYADRLAKELMTADPLIREQVSRLLGPEAYSAGQLNRSWIAQQVFGDEEKLALLNTIIHPAVGRYSAQWFYRQTSAYAIKEAALFFESGTDKEMDLIIGVSAPYELRISRTILRDGISQRQVEERMARQMDEAEKMRRCHFVLVNDDHHSLIEQVLSLHRELMSRTAV